MAVETAPAPSQGKLYQGVAKDAFGYKMMAAMGWSEGKGLGAKETGITKHISAKKRVDLTGIGADWKADDSAKVNWCANTHNFEQVLANLHAEYGAAAAEGKKRKKKKGKSKGGDSPEASGDARAAEAGSSSSSEEDADAKRARLRPQENARGRPQGRYKKREMGKMVKGYSATDLNQILGVVPGTEDPFAAAAAFAVSVQPAAAADSEEEESEEEAPRPAKKASKEKKEEKKKRRKAKGSDAEAEEAGRAARSASEREATVSAGRTRSAAAESDGDDAEEQEGPLGTPPAPGWWGEKMFVWVGVLGQIRREKKRGRGFDEEEQERVYTEAHEHKVQNRQGLGQKERPKKVAGARWEGKKVTFGGEGAGDSDGGSGDSDGGGGEEAGAGAAPAKKAGAGSGLKSPDKKLSESALAEAGGSMKLSALQRAALAAAGVPPGHAAEGTYLEALMRRLQKSSRFSVGAKKVKLVAGAEGDDD